MVQTLPPDTAARLLAGMVTGLTAGLLPVYLAKRKGLSTWASLAAASCALAGVLFGVVVAAPVALGFTWWITRQEAGSES